MNRTNITYRPLGEFIKLVDERNKDLKVKNLQGLSIEKKFIPSIANTIGTDMSTYRVVKPRQFAYGPVTSRNGDKVTVALYKGEESAIISYAYLVFEITDFNQLLPEYLMMWFLRPEFDRYARFHSHGSAREIFDWDELCATQIPVPPIEEQHRIVEQYNAVQRRIEIQTKLITKLQDTAQALYRKMFVDGIDKNHLPEGWRVGTLGEIAQISSGKTCSNKTNEKNGENKYPVAGASGIIGYSASFNQDERLLTTGRVGTLGVVNRYNEKMYAADNVLIVKTTFYEYCYQVLRNIDYNEITKGGVQSLITQTDLSNYQILIPALDVLNLFESKLEKIFDLIDRNNKENKKLNEIKSLLLAIKK